MDHRFFFHGDIAMAGRFDVCIANARSNVLLRKHFVFRYMCNIVGAGSKRSRAVPPALATTREDLSSMIQSNSKSAHRARFAGSCFVLSFILLLEVFLASLIRADTQPVAPEIPSAAAATDGSTVGDEVIRYFPGNAPAPDPASKEFLDVQEQQSTLAEDFNQINQRTRSVVITGLRVTIDDTQPDGLWRRFSGATDIKQLTIRAEVIAIYSAFELPGTDVTFIAQEGLFAGNPNRGGADTAAIITTPRTPLNRTAFGENGGAGQRAGNIRLQVAKFTSVPGVKRLIMSGGAGGNPGPGKDGSAGKSMPLVTEFGQPSQANNQDGLRDNAAVYVRKNSVKCSKCNPTFDYSSGTPEFPTSGSDAVPGGIPGTGGAGGNLFATLSTITQFANQSGGLSGKSAGSYVGGAAGTPTFAIHASIDDNDHGRYWHLLAVGPVTSVGASAVSPAAPVPQGLNGGFTLLPDGNAWLTASVARQHLALATAAYRSALYPQARTEVEALAATLATNVSLGENAAELASIKDQVESLRLRLLAGRSYFDLPTGWSPIVSLQVSAAALDSAIQRAIVPIYIHQFVSAASKSLTEKIAAIGAARTQAIEDVNKDNAAINSALNSVAQLEAEARAITETVQQLTDSLQRLEQEQLRQAAAAAENEQIRKRLPEWQKVVKAAGALLKLTPISAPIGQALDVGLQVNAQLASITAATPWTDIDKIVELSQTAKPLLSILDPASFAKGAQDFSDTISKLDPSKLKPEDWPAYIENLRKLAGSVDTGVQNIRTALGPTMTVTNGEVAAQLARLQAEDPVLDEIRTKIAALMSRKAAFAQALAEQMQIIARNRDAITDSLLGVASYDRQLSATAGILDSEVLTRLGHMSQRAQDDLLWYQFVVAAAYQHAMLQPYPGHLDLSRLISRVSQAVQAGSAAMPTADVAATVNLFKVDMADTARGVFDYFSSTYASLVLPVVIDLDAAQLALLNQGQSFVLNPQRAAMIHPGHDGARIVEIRISNLRASVASGTANGQFADVTLKVVHPGTGRLAKDGKIYEFYYYPTSTQSPVSWGTIYDLRRNRTAVITPSLASSQLLASLVGLTTLPNGSAFTSLAADADLLVSLESFSDTNAKLRLDGATIELVYEFVPAKKTTNTLQLGASGALMPVLQPNVPDAYQRLGATGPVLRSYPAGTTVRITAPPVYQETGFLGWADQFGNTLNADPSDPRTLSIVMDNPKTAIATYGFQAAAVFPTVSVIATDANASEQGLDPGTFVVSRTGSTSAALTVILGVGGTASSSDFDPIGTTITFPPGAATTTITIRPIDDLLVEGSETVTVQLLPGNGYVVGAPSAATVTIADNDLSPPPAPTISSQPSALTVNAGATATFSVTATSTTTLTYLWRKNSAAIATATSSVLTLPNVTTSDSADYSVTVTNSGGMVTSNIARLTVNTVAAPPPPPPVVVPPPVVLPPPLPAVVALLPQTIAISVPANGLVINQSTALAASSTAGLPVTFSLVRGDARLSGNVLTPLGASEIVVRAAHPGNATYAAASSELNLGTPRKADQSIALIAPSAMRTTDNPVSVSAQATSGLPVTLVVSGPAVLTGNTLTLTGAPGTIAIRATQSGNGAYAAATDVTRAIVVDAAGPQIFLGAIGPDAFGATITKNNESGVLVVRLSATGEAAVFKFKVERDGTFTTKAKTSAAASEAGVQSLSDEPPRAASARELTLNGRVENGVLVGTLVESNTTFAANVQLATGPTAAVTGLYVASVPGSVSGEIYIVAGSSGAAFALAVLPNSVTSGLGTVSSSGTISVQLSQNASINAALNQDTGTVNGTVTTTGAIRTFVGLGGDTPRTDRMVNLSSRLRVVSGDGSRVVIVGFVITSATQRQILVRAVGPGLSAFGVTDVLANPKLQLFDSAGKLVDENAGWNATTEINTTADRVGAFKLTPGSRDSAILATVSAGAYTAQVTSATNNGVVLIEVYDTATGAQLSNEQLVNLSTRGFVDTGEGQLVAGFVVTGNAPKRVLIRGIGPALTGFGVSGVVADPLLKLYGPGSANPIAQNDNWEIGQSVSSTQVAATAADISAANIAAGAFPLASRSKDAALVITLMPGNYSAVVSGAANSTGAGLIEVYQLPER